MLGKKGLKEFTLVSLIVKIVLPVNMLIALRQSYHFISSGAKKPWDNKLLFYV